MRNLGAARRGFSLGNRPSRLFRRRSGGVAEKVPVFEPYEENLPLESGFYSFVLDEEGRFRLLRGNTSSHAKLVGGEAVGAAGNIRINRNGCVAEVVCISLDYSVFAQGPLDPLVGFVLRSFRLHHALEVSPNALFRFTRKPYETFDVDVEGRELDAEEVADRRRRLETEGQGVEIALTFTSEQVEAFACHRPSPPSRLYPMHLDQLVTALEDGADDEPFRPGPPREPFSPAHGGLTTGKKAFVVDREGLLLVGHGHHLLSGGHPVGAAGQIIVGRSGTIEEVNLNFSGHYRPPLDAGYARYTYAALISHPLLRFAPDLRILGRKFDAAGELSTNIQFFPEDFEGDDAAIATAIHLFSW